MSLLTNPYWLYPAATGGATPRIVQSTVSADTGGNLSLPLTLSNVTAGNALIVTLSGYNGNPNVLDTAKDGSTSLTMYQAFTPGGNYSMAAIGYEFNVAAGSHTVTVSNASTLTSSYYTAALHEVSGLSNASPNVSVNGTTTGATLTLAGSTPSVNNCFIITVIADDGEGSTSTATITTPSGYTSLWQELNGANYQLGAAAYQIQTTAAPVAPSWTGLNAAGGAGFAAVALAFN